MGLHDSLLETTSLTKLSECNNQTEDIDTTPNQPATCQETTPSDSRVLDSIHTLKQGDSIHISDSTHLSKSIDRISTASTSGISIKELNQGEGHTFSYDTSTNDSEQSQVPMTSTSGDVKLAIEPAYKAIVRCHDKLVTAFSTDILTISGVLVAREFIPPEISGKMLLPNLTPQEKATSLVSAITKKIKLDPDQFQELIKIFSEQACTKDIVTSLSSHVSCEQNADDYDTGVVSGSQQHAVCEGHMYTVWEDLSPADKINLEARLITDVEEIRKEFAVLCWKVRDSFEQRDITPQTLASALLDLTIREDENRNILHLREKEEELMNAKSVHDILNIIRPHMNFFNHEILQFLIQVKGSKDDEMALSRFLRKFKEFCKHHVFEVPFITYSHEQNPHNLTQQRLHVMVTRHFKAALLTQAASESVPTTSDSERVEKICSNELGINLEDARNIQCKLAKILNLKPSLLFLDTFS